jgi:hypothetical protein
MMGVRKVPGMPQLLEEESRLETLLAPESGAVRQGNWADSRQPNRPACPQILDFTRIWRGCDGLRLPLLPSATGAVDQ